MGADVQSVTMSALTCVQYATSPGVVFNVIRSFAAKKDDDKPNKKDGDSWGDL